MVWFPGVHRLYVSLQKTALTWWLVSHHRYMHHHTTPATPRLTWYAFALLTLAPLAVGALGLLLSRLA